MRLGRGLQTPLVWEKKMGEIEMDWNYEGGEERGEGCEREESSPTRFFGVRRPCPFFYRNPLYMLVIDAADVANNTSDCLGPTFGRVRFQAPSSLWKHTEIERRPLMPFPT